MCVCVCLFVSFDYVCLFLCLVTSERVDYVKGTWEWIAAKGTQQEVLTFLEKEPKALNVDLSRLAWRLTEASFFDRVTGILKDRQVWEPVVWMYSLMSDKGGKELGEYLASQDSFRQGVWPFLKCELVNYDPQE